MQYTEAVMRRPSVIGIEPLKRVLSVALVLGIVLVGTIPPMTAQALTNDFILSDHDFFGAQSMSAERIQRFLVNHGSSLAQFTVQDNGTTKRAADLIAETSQQYGVSPKFFLTLLQKEQSLITDPNPSQNQLDYALGYGCPSSCSPAYRGFATQLRAAGKRIAEDYVPALKERGHFNGWGPGIPKLTIDNILVTPANIATSVLYIYNPYVGNRGGGDPRYGANSLFQYLWLQWFVRKHPDGSLLRVRGGAGVWLIRDGKRSAFKSRAAFLSNYDFSKVIVVDQDEIETYDLGPPLLFPEPSLLQVQAGGIYLLVNGTKRPIASKEVFRSLGYNPEEVIRGVSERDLDAYPKGSPVTTADIYPTGRLFKSKRTGGVVYIDASGIRHSIHSKEIFRSQFRHQRPTFTEDETIGAYPLGEPVKFRDGELVASRTERKIYFISHGQRRYIPDFETFRQLGLNMKNVIFTNDRSIGIHPLGEPLSDVTIAQ